MRAPSRVDPQMTPKVCDIAISCVIAPPASGRTGMHDPTLRSAVLYYARRNLPLDLLSLLPSLTLIGNAVHPQQDIRGIRIIRLCRLLRAATMLKVFREWQIVGGSTCALVRQSRVMGSCRLAPTLRWCSSVGNSALRAIAAKRLGWWSRRRVGRPCRRLEGPSVRAAGVG